MVFMELLFWSNPREGMEIIDGYEENGGASATARQKKSHWSDEVMSRANYELSALQLFNDISSQDEEKLERMYGQFKEMWEKDPSEDILLNLCTMFEERKTRRQILRKLKEMNLVQVGESSILRLLLVVEL